jgi:hypothetical protein
MAVVANKPSYLENGKGTLRFLIIDCVRTCTSRVALGKPKKIT